MKTILSTNGHELLVDDEDYESLCAVNWSFNPACGAYTTVGTYGDNADTSHYNMSRVIMGLDFGDPRQIDHINHNRADNQKTNLRICTPSQNRANSRKNSLCSSKYKGASWSKKDGKWKAQITVNRRTFYLGLFADELDAAAAYDIAALQHFGKFALCNFEIVAGGLYV